MTQQQMIQKMKEDKSFTMYALVYDDDFYYEETGRFHPTNALECADWYYKDELDSVKERFAENCFHPDHICFTPIAFYFRDDEEDLY